MVVLPWARRQIAEEELRLQEEAADNVKTDEIGLDDALVQHDSFELLVSKESTKKLPQALAQWHLPYSPPPHIPDEERIPLNEDRLIGLAVVLDILSTQTTDLEENPLILSQLQAIFSQSGELGGIDTAGRQRLLDFAKGGAGRERSKLAQRFFDAAQEELQPNAEEAAIHKVPTHLQCTPQNVAASLRVIESFAKILRQEVQLRLGQSTPVHEYQA